MEPHPRAFLLGIVSGEPVGTISAVEYASRRDGDKPYGFIGFFIVRADQRRKGFGKLLFDAGLERLANDAVHAQVQRYAKLGFVAAHLNAQFQTAAAPCERTDPSVVPDVPLETLVGYDAKVHPGSRGDFIRWFSHPKHRKRALIDSNGGIRGYGVIRRSESGWRIGPLLADSADDARGLLAALCNAVPAGELVILDVPKANSAAVALAVSAGMTRVFETVRMYHGPPTPVERVFGLTTLEIG